MFGAFLGDLYAAIPEPLVVDIAPELKGKTRPLMVKLGTIRETVTRIENSITKILESDIRDLQSNIESQIVAFQSDLYKMNTALFGEILRREDIPNYANTERFLFDRIRDVIIQQVHNIRYIDTESTKNAILGISEQLSNYDNMILGIICTEAVSLKELLEVTNTTVLRNYESGSVLVFLSEVVPC